MSRLLRAALVAAAVLLALGGRAVGDGPEAGPFPYGELALLGAAEAPVRVVLREASVARLRPAGDWPAVAEVEAGDWATALAATPDGGAWLKVKLASGAAGWLPRADVAGSTPRISSLPADDAGALRAWPRAAVLEVFDWPGSPPARTLSRADGPFGVFGRSADGKWAALASTATLNAAVVWARASEITLTANDVSIVDLPIFLGRGVSAIPLGDPAGREARLAGPADEWIWTPAGAIHGFDAERVWRFNPTSGVMVSLARPPGAAVFSPDGEHLAVLSCDGDWFECLGPHDVTILPMDGGEPVTFRDVYSRNWAERPIETRPFTSPFGQWSPDGRYLLIPSFGDAPDHSAISVDGESHRIPAAWLEEDVRHRLFVFWATGRRHAVAYAFRDGDGEHNYTFALNGELLDEAMQPLQYQSLQYQSERRFLPELRREAWLDWSPDQSYAFVGRGSSSEPEDNRAWLYRASDESLTEIPHSEGGRHLVQDAHWSPRSDAFLLKDLGAPGAESIAGLWLVHVDPLSTAAIQRDGFDGFACGNRGGSRSEWRRGGDELLIELFDHIEYWSEDDQPMAYAPDGLAARHGMTGQIRIYDRQGELLHIFRTHPELVSLYSDRRAEQSSDGRWLALGPHGRGPGCEWRS